MKTFNITINGEKIRVKEGMTILQAANSAGIDIPTLCYHSDLEAKGTCRICVVEIKGQKDLSASCCTKVLPKMDILTESLKVKRARKINLELIFAHHCEECNDCLLDHNCQLLRLAGKYGVKISRFKDRKKGFAEYQFGPSVFFDSSKCIECQNCLEVCALQKVNFLKLKKGDEFNEISPDKNKECIYCGQCIVHCPVGALQAVGEFEDVEKPLQDKTKKVVFQIAPSIRTSIGEEFKMEPGTITTGKLASAIRKLGADLVFDTTVGADFTTVEEAKELLEKIENNKTPCFSSCCPAWVRFVELNFPEFIPNIATTKSPQIILGGLIKTYWAQKQKIDPKNIIVVSVMPCVAKKYEIKRKELEIKGMPPVDIVLTTRELAYLLKKHKINLAKMQEEPLDDPLRESSGAGVIYGTTGGVLESVLRTVYDMQKTPFKIDFKKARGMESVKKAKIKLKNKTIKVAVANGISGAVSLLEELKKDPKAFDALEVMACPGGCIGGGGQPIPVDAEIRKKRAEALYSIDKNKKIRLANKNPIIEKIYSEFLTSEKIIKEICHAKYKSREIKFLSNK